MSKAGEAALVVTGVGIFFGLIGLLEVFSVWTFAFGFVWGSYLGFAALPFFNSRKWKPQPGICSLVAVALVAVSCYFLEVSSTTYWIAIPVAALIGYLAPYWAPHA